jgi:16S rRNA (guanine966-N2)-methyltransferase
MARQKRKSDKSTRKASPAAARPVAGLRIIGGKFRGRKLRYSGDIRTRPMKDRLREAIFNLLGPSVRRALAVDLFAGTGALGLEAISRGADRALLIEQHHPTADIIRQNAAELGLTGQVEVAVGNSFLWWKMNRNDAVFSQEIETGDGRGIRPWVVFCSPPYAFYVDRADELLELLAEMIEASPPESVFLVEADERFDFQQLPLPSKWDVRNYAPAVVGILRKQAK